MRMYGLFLRDLYPEGRCLAKTRKATPCKIRGEVFQCKNGALRCRYHGGLSTGPKTPEGKERALKALRDGWRRWRLRIVGAEHGDAQSPDSPSENHLPVP